MSATSIARSQRRTNRRPGTTEKGGRPARLLDPNVHETIVKAIELGVPISIACQGVGIAEQSYRNWLHRGADENEKRAVDGYEPHDTEQPYVDFFLAITEARSKAATRNIGLIQKVAAGGIVTEKTTRKYRDAEGNLVEEETIKRTAPDWRAAAWYLERSHRSEYGKDATVVELTTTATAGEAPADASPAGDLAARLEAHIAAGVPQLTAAQVDITSGTDDDVYDAEVVETA